MITPFRQVASRDQHGNHLGQLFSMCDHSTTHMIISDSSWRDNSFAVNRNSLTKYVVELIVISKKLLRGIILNGIYFYKAK